MHSLPRVLVPSDHRDWVVNFADAYRRLGFDVTTGSYNFDLEASQPDIVHFLWPEELTGWKVPSPAQIDAAIARLDRWARRSRLIITVNNLYPHGQHGNPHWHRLYTAFYERAEVIHHFSQASKELVCQEFPAVADRNHVVRLGFNYDLMLPVGPRDRAASRRAYGFAPQEMVYLVFGTLRFWDEVQLIKRAFTQANVAGKRLFMAARYNEPGSSWRLRWNRWQWRQWQRRNKVLRVTDYVPDEEVYSLFDAADAVVVIRQNSMSSGVPSLAMTFGRMVVAPNFGGIPEYLGGADNLLYDGTSASSLSKAMEHAANLDREAIGAKNREVAAGWGWDGIIRTCLDALPSTESERHSPPLVSLTTS
jgi:glycosyltransferase involved in cell wall biosynthesis